MLMTVLIVLHGLIPHSFLRMILSDTVIIYVFWIKALWIRFRESQHFSYSLRQQVNLRPGIRTKGGLLLTTGQADGRQGERGECSR